MCFMIEKDKKFLPEKRKILQKNLDRFFTRKGQKKHSQNR